MIFCYCLFYLRVNVSCSLFWYLSPTLFVSIVWNGKLNAVGFFWCQLSKQCSLIWRFSVVHLKIGGTYSHFVPVLTFVNLGTFNSVKTCKNLYKTHVVLKQDTERLSFWGAWNWFQLKWFHFNAWPHFRSVILFMS